MHIANISLATGHWVYETIDNFYVVFQLIDEFNNYKSEDVYDILYYITFIEVKLGANTLSKMLIGMSA